jgi:uncharacterized protein YcbK (DUF882 family)
MPPPNGHDPERALTYRLSAHFRLSEFRCADGTPAPAHAVDELELLCRRFLEPLRAAHGVVTVLSGYRTPRHNAAVGGAPRSFHVYLRNRRGVAADVRCARGAAADWYRTLQALNPGGLGSYSTHVHVDTRAGHARW